MDRILKKVEMGKSITTALKNILKIFSRKRYQFSVRNKKVYKIRKLCRAIFFSFYNISRPNFGISKTKITNFRMLFNAVVMNFPISTFFKILSIMQSVYWLARTCIINMRNVTCVMWHAWWHKLPKFPTRVAFLFIFCSVTLLSILPGCSLQLYV